MAEKSFLLKPCKFTEKFYKNPVNLQAITKGVRKTMARKTKFFAIYDVTDEDPVQVGKEEAGSGKTALRHYLNSKKRDTTAWEFIQLDTNVWEVCDQTGSRLRASITNGLLN